MKNKEHREYKMLKVYGEERARVKLLAVKARLTIPEMLIKILDYYEGVNKTK